MRDLVRKEKQKADSKKKGRKSKNIVLKTTTTTTDNQERTSEKIWWAVSNVANKLKKIPFNGFVYTKIDNLENSGLLWMVGR